MMNESRGDDDEGSNGIDGEVDELVFAKKDIHTLLQRLQELVKAKPALSKEKIDWERVAFDHFDGVACKKAYMTHRRKFLLRLSLKEELPALMQQCSRLAPIAFYHNIKHPRSAYSYFVQEKSQHIRNKLPPGSKRTQVLTEVVKLWAAIDERKKQKYVDMAKTSREEFVATKRRLGIDDDVVDNDDEEEATTSSPKKKKKKQQTVNGIPALPPPPPMKAVDLYIDEEWRQFKERHADYDDEKIRRKLAKKYNEKLSDAERKAYEDRRATMASKYLQALKRTTNLVSKQTHENIEREMIEALGERQPKMSQDSNGFLYYRRTMAETDEFKSIPQMIDRYKAITQRWLLLSEPKKDKYKQKAQQARERFEEEVDAYLAPINDDERKERFRKYLLKK